MIWCIFIWYGGVSEEIIFVDDVNVWVWMFNSEFLIMFLFFRVLWVCGDSIFCKEFCVFLVYLLGINIWKWFLIMVVFFCLRKVFVYFVFYEVVLLWFIVLLFLIGFEVCVSDLWMLVEVCFGCSVDSGCFWGCCDIDEVV